MVPNAGSRIRAMHDSLLREYDVEPVVAAECSHQETVIELVRSGVGAIIASSSRAAALAGSGLEVRGVRPRVDVDLCAVRRSDAPAPVAEAFLASAGQAPRPPRTG